MKPHKKNRRAENEEELRRKERQNGILDEPEELQHPHDIKAPVGEDPSEYFTEELSELGYTDDGLMNPNAAQEDEPRARQLKVRKVA